MVIVYYTVVGWTKDIAIGIIRYTYRSQNTNTGIRYSFALHEKIRCRKRRKLILHNARTPATDIPWPSRLGKRSTALTGATNVPVAPPTPLVSCAVATNRWRPGRNSPRPSSTRPTGRTGKLSLRGHNRRDLKLQPPTATRYRKTSSLVTTR